ncbi:MAG: hypothetical protein H0V70_12655 [Ktedonobacteraceae bacterium]|nr:hypothetical protein [Ktedonobacteraceae bacterium]
MIKKRRKRNLIPPWQMPSDPVKAVFWFMFWFLRLLVNIFWLPIIVMVIIEVILNLGSAGGVLSALVAGIVTLLVGLIIWGGLYGVTVFLTIGTRVSRVLSDVNSIQKGFSARSPFYPLNDSPSEQNVVEGTITDLDEERRKRRQSE